MRFIALSPHNNKIMLTLVGFRNTVSEICRRKRGPLECGGKRQRDTALDFALISNWKQIISKAPSPLRFAGALQKSSP
jgi:hypothetical protein